MPYEIVLDDGAARPIAAVHASVPVGQADSIRAIGPTAGPSPPGANAGGAIVSAGSLPGVPRDAN